MCQPLSSPPPPGLSAASYRVLRAGPSNASRHPYTQTSAHRRQCISPRYHVARATRRLLLPSLRSFGGTRHLSLLRRCRPRRLRGDGAGVEWLVVSRYETPAHYIPNSFATLLAERSVYGTLCAGYSAQHETVSLVLLCLCPHTFPLHYVIWHNLIINSRSCPPEALNRLLSSRPPY